MSESLDPRWSWLYRRSWTCKSCEEVHLGVFDLGCAKPDAWQDPEVQLPNAAVMTSAHCLTEDFCILDGEHYFIRCVLELPLIGAPPGEHFAFGVWSSLSKQNFDLYVHDFDGEGPGNLGPWFGWFSNRIKGYPDTLNLKCHVHPQQRRRRPRIELEPTEHPLAHESRTGISFERLVEIYAANGHTLAITPP